MLTQTIFSCSCKNLKIVGSPVLKFHDSIIWSLKKMSPPSPLTAAHSRTDIGVSCWKTFVVLVHALYTVYCSLQPLLVLCACRCIFIFYFYFFYRGNTCAGGRRTHGFNARTNRFAYARERILGIYIYVSVRVTILCYVRRDTSRTR